MAKANTKVLQLSKTALPNLFGTRKQFHERQFFHGRVAVGDGFRVIFTRSIQPRSFTSTVHSRVHTSMRLSNVTADLTGGGALAVMRVMQSSYKYRWSFTFSPVAHILLYGLLPNRPWTSTSLWLQKLGIPAQRHCWTTKPIQNYPPPDSKKAFYFNPVLVWHWVVFEAENSSKEDPSSPFLSLSTFFTKGFLKFTKDLGVA